MKVTKTETKESTKHSCGYGCHQKDSAEHEGEGGRISVEGQQKTTSPIQLQKKRNCWKKS